MSETPVLTTTDADQIICCYVNATSKVQVVRIKNVSHWYFERVVFPGQRLIFYSFPDALLEVHTHELAALILCDRIPCQQITLDECDTHRFLPLGQPV